MPTKRSALWAEVDFPGFLVFDCNNIFKDQYNFQKNTTTRYTLEIFYWFFHNKRRVVPLLPHYTLHAVGFAPSKSQILHQPMKSALHVPHCGKVAVLMRLPRKSILHTLRAQHLRGPTSSPAICIVQNHTLHPHAISTQARST